MKRNIILITIAILLLTCTFGFARTTTTDLELVKPAWTEDLDILTDINANSDILEAFANDPLEFYSVVDGDIPNDITIDLATLATTLTVTDNESTNETNAILFTSGGDLDGGNLGIECDGDLHYNPSTGALTAKMHRVYMVSETTALNAAWLQITSSVVTGDLTGLRTVMTSSAASGGDAVTGVNVRGVYGQAVCAASKHAGLLQGGLFTASVAAGSCTIYNVHVLTGHYSSGASTTIGGDLYIGYLRAQTRSTNARSVTGHDVLLALENEAIEGSGAVMDSAIRIFDTNVASSGFTYGIDLSDSVIATADIRLSNSETISNTTDGRVTVGGADLNIDTGKKYLINGTQITSGALSDVASIAMLDEAETIAGNWVNTDNPWADNEVSDDITITAADTTDTTCFVALWETVTGAQKVKSDAGITYNAGTGDLSSTKFGGIAEANLLDKTAVEAITANWTSTGTLDLAYTSTGAGGETGFESHIIQTTAGLTGTLRGAYITASNAQTSASTGTIRGLEVKARAEAVGESGGTVAVLEGISISADSKDQSVTTMRGIEVMLDGSTGGTVTEGVGIRIANNMQADKITTMTALQIYSDSFPYDYGIDMSQGAGGIDTDIKFSDDDTIISGTSGLAISRVTQLGFAATQSASADANTLDDYEEGTWAPTVTFGGASVDMTYTSQLGFYTKIGRQVIATCYILLSAKGTSVGAAKIENLPFNCNSTFGAFSAPSLRISDITFANMIQGYVSINSDEIVLNEVTEAGAETALTEGNFANNSKILMTATYFTD